ncbi:unnamed protein product [Linum trigynum]|uniref:Uncharacterized protein n=1 Tax=Linum trigynum TaxID=586398 RepID=A0AAV2CI78_9ROSI
MRKKAPVEEGEEEEEMAHSLLDLYRSPSIEIPIPHMPLLLLLVFTTLPSSADEPVTPIRRPTLKQTTMATTNWVQQRSPSYPIPISWILAHPTLMTIPPQPLITRRGN